MRHEADVIGAVGHARDRITSERIRLDRRRVEAQQRKDAAEDALARVTTLTQAAARAEQAVRRQIDRRSAALATAERERAHHQAEVDRLEAESKRLEQLIRRLAREKAARARAAARAAAEKARRERASRTRPTPTRRPPRSTRTRPSTPPPSTGGLMWPTSGPITSSYGWRVHPIFGTRRLHAGIDIGAPSGQSVRAAAGGVVSFSGWMGGYGNIVLVDHGRVTTAYAHLSSRSVGVGQSVSRGRTIGRVGSTGNSTGPHLHFETRVNGSPVNPMNYF
jgi:murein DD-endopeptidase MepM/ murein hydrolase activator NlpD